jgi:hypothetical protein
VRATMRAKKSQAQLGAARRGNEQADKSNRAGNERRSRACPAELSGSPSLPRLVTCSRRKQAAPPDRMAEIGIAERSAAKIAGADGNDPRMSGDDRAADRALVARRGHDDDALPGGASSACRSAILDCDDDCIKARRRLITHAPPSTQARMAAASSSGSALGDSRSSEVVSAKTGRTSSVQSGHRAGATVSRPRRRRQRSHAGMPRSSPGCKLLQLQAN